MSTPLLIAFYVLFPAFVLYLAIRVPIVDRIGPVVICYLAGIVLGNSGVLPDGVTGLQDTLTEATVALSLPLLLFSTDVRRWVTVAGKAMLSMLLAIGAVVGVASAAVPVFLSEMDEGWQVAGMAIGVYTGGTPNVAAIKTALDVEPSLFVAVHSYDLLAGTFYLLFTLTFAQRFFLLFLPPFRTTAEASGDGTLELESIDAYRDLFTTRVLPGLVGASVLAALIVGGSVAIGSLAPPDYGPAVVILAITTLALVASLARPIRDIPRTFQLGMYVIYVFCVVVGSMASLEIIADLDPLLLAYMTTCIFGTMAVHALLARVFAIDADTFVITSVAAVCSPPFVPVVAGALRNRTIVLSGIAAGILGYAVGNYLGITVALALRAAGGG